MDTFFCPGLEGSTVLRNRDVMVDGYVLYCTIVAKPRTTERKVMSPRAERAPLNTRQLREMREGESLRSVQF